MDENGGWRSVCHPAGLVLGDCTPAHGQSSMTRSKSKSTRLRLSDVRQLVRLVVECRDLGDDARRWRTHLVAGLARLTGAGMGISAEMGDCVRGPRRDLGAADWGWENGFDKPAW